MSDNAVSIDFLKKKNFLAPHLGHIYINYFYSTVYYTICRLYGRAAAVSVWSTLSAVAAKLLCPCLLAASADQWARPLRLLHPFLRLLPSYFIPANNCCIHWWSSCQFICCCCSSAAQLLYYSCTGAATATADEAAACLAFFLWA